MIQVFAVLFLSFCVNKFYTDRSRHVNTIFTNEGHRSDHASLFGAEDCSIVAVFFR